MLASDIFALIWFVTDIGIFVFALSTIVNLVRKRPAKEDGKKTLVFFVLSIIFLIIFGIVFDNETEKFMENGIDESTHHQHHDSEHTHQD